MHIRWMAVMVVAAMIGCGLVWAPTADAQPANEVKIYAGEDEKRPRRRGSCPTITRWG